MSKMVELNLNPDEHTLRQFGFIAFFGFGALAAFAYFEKFIFAMGLGGARMTVAGVLGALAVISLLFSLVYPKANRAVFVGTSVLAYPIGFVMSYFIMGLLFFGIMAPIGALLKVLGNDPMQRALERDKASYWSPPLQKRDKASYFKQF